MADYTGTIGNDTQAGTGADESFDYSQGGQDTLSGGGGADFFNFGGALDAGDEVDGGDGFDELMLIGDYSGGLVLADDTFTNIERLSLSDGFDYSLTLADGNVQAGGRLDVVLNGSSNRIDATAVVHGSLDFEIGSIGPSVNVRSGAGDDGFHVDKGIGRNMVLDGGDGLDTVYLAATFGHTRLADHSLRGIEAVQITAAGWYTFADGNVAAGETLTVTLVPPDAGPSHPPAALGLRADGHKELDGHFLMTGGVSGDILIGGHQDDTLRGGAGGDVLIGGEGADRLHGGGGHDRYVFDSVRDSHKGSADLINGLAPHDLIDLSNIDADKALAGHQSFTLVESFSHIAGELMLTYDAEHNRTHILGDIDGDAKADLMIDVIGDATGFDGFVLGAG